MQNRGAVRHTWSGTRQNPGESSNFTNYSPGFPPTRPRAFAPSQLRPVLSAQRLRSSEAHGASGITPTLGVLDSPAFCVDLDGLQAGAKVRGHSGKGSTVRRSGQQQPAGGYLSSSTSPHSWMTESSLSSPAWESVWTLSESSSVIAVPKRPLPMPSVPRSAGR